MKMIYTPGSDNITRFAWDGTNLYIEFKKTLQVYGYLDCPSSVYDAMLVSESVGSFFHACVKKAFVCVKLPEVQARAMGFELTSTV